MFCMGYSSMDFSECEIKLYNTIWEFAKIEVAPLAAQINAQSKIPDALRKKLAEQGYFNRSVPKKFGGLEGSQVDLCLQSEAVSYHSITVGSSMLASTLCLTPIALFGSDYLREKIMTRVASGESSDSIGITEPDFGSDATSMATSAVKSEGKYVLNGAKHMIDNTDVSKFFLVWARTDAQVRPKHCGISAFVVEREAPGFEVLKIVDLLGLRGLGVGAFAMSDCEAPGQNLIGEENKGWHYLMKMLEYGREATAALCVGLAQAALDGAKDYAKKCIQFGKTLASFQAIQMKIADMATAIDTARLLVYRAARLTDKGKRCEREASMAKYYSGETVSKVAHEALQIHGGVSYTKDFPVERQLRDARCFSIGGGNIGNSPYGGSPQGTGHVCLRLSRFLLLTLL